MISDGTLNFEKMVRRESFSNIFDSLGSNAPLVREYTKRELTVQGDILKAFNGIETALSKSLGTFH
jgi:hypothetical protein